MSKEIFKQLVFMGAKMVLDGTPVGMSVAVLARTNGLNPSQSVRLKDAIIKSIR